MQCYDKAKHKTNRKFSFHKQAFLIKIITSHKTLIKNKHYKQSK